MQQSNQLSFNTVDEQPGAEDQKRQVPLDSKIVERFQPAIKALAMYDRAYKQEDYDVVIEETVSTELSLRIREKLELFQSALDFGLPLDMCAQTHYHMGVLQCRLGKWQEALNSITLAHTTPGLPEDVQSHSYFIEGLVQQKLGKLKVAAANYKMALVQLQKLGRNDPLFMASPPLRIWQSRCVESWIGIYYQEGFDHIKKGKYTNATASFDQVIGSLPEIYPGFKKNPQLLKCLAESLFERNQLIITGKFTVTSSALQQGVTACQEAMDYYTMRARLLRGERPLGENDNQDFYSQYAVITSELEKFCAECYALKSRLLLKSFEVDSRDSSPRHDFSSDPIQAENYLENFARACRLNPNQANAFYNSAVPRSNCRVRDRRVIVRYCEIYTSILVINKLRQSTSQPIIELINVLIANNYYQDAYNNLKQYAQELKEHRLYVYTQRALCLLQMTQNEEALSDFRAAIRVIQGNYEKVWAADLSGVSMDHVLKQKERLVAACRIRQEEKNCALKKTYEERHTRFNAQLDLLRRDLKKFKKTHGELLKVLLSSPLSEPADVARFMGLVKQRLEEGHQGCQNELLKVIDFYLRVFVGMEPLVDLAEARPLPLSYVPVPSAPSAMDIGEATKADQKSGLGKASFFSVSATTTNSPTFASKTASTGLGGGPE